MADSDAAKAKRLTAVTRVNPRTRSAVFWIAALATIAVGFADLARGGTAIAPVLLVVGYCVLVPLAILK